MQIITKKNISLALAIFMALCIISTAKANRTVQPDKRTAVFIHSEELVEFVEMYFEEFEMNDSFELEQRVKLFDQNDQVIFSGFQKEMDEHTAQLFHKADYLSEMAGSAYYKIL